MYLLHQTAQSKAAHLQTRTQMPTDPSAGIGPLTRETLPKQQTSNKATYGVNTTSGTRNNCWVVSENEKDIAG